MLSANSPVSAQEATAHDKGADQQSGALDEVVVTARRREENLQSTPVSVTVLTGEQLHGKGIKSLYDLNSFTPGLNYSYGASKSAPTVSLRGMSRGLAGNAQPAVGTYFNDVPGLTASAAMPAYDISSIQVVKGPQGTLFGRNTTAGAILVTSKPPTYEFGASAEATVGSYDWRQLDVVLNAPVIADKLAVRVAGQFMRRDGYTKVANVPGLKVDRVMVDNVRISLLAEPFEGLRNITVYDSTTNYRASGGAVLYKTFPGTYRNIAFFNGTLLYTNPPTPCNGSPVCNLDVALQRQIAVGPRTNWSDLTNPFAKSKTRSVTNTTTLDLGFATLKNIFGYRRFYLFGSSNIEGLELIFVSTYTSQAVKQTSDELQLAGEAFGGNLNWIAGGFWLKSQPSEPQAGIILSVVPTNTNFVASALGTSPFFYDESKAAFAQVNFKFAGISDSLSGLSADLGARYTRDTSKSCTITGVRITSPVPAPSDCPASVTPIVHFKKLTYTAGLNWQVNRDVLAYGVHRRGYRGGFTNSPILGGQLVPFQGVKPETVDDFEIGVKSEWRIAERPLRVNIAAFNSHYKDMQASLSTTGIADPDGNGNPLDNPSGNTFYVNVGKARVKGVELETAFSPVKGLELTGSASWISKRVTDISLTGLPPAVIGVNPITPKGLSPVAFSGAPSYGYSAGATYTLPLADKYGKVSLAVRYFRTSLIRYTAFEQPAYEIWNANVDWTRVMGSDFDLGLFVNNVSNIATPVGPGVSSAGFGLLSAFYTEPRMVGVRLRYAFGGER